MKRSAILTAAAFAIAALSSVSVSLSSEKSGPTDIALGARLLDVPASKNGFRPAGVKITRMFAGGNLTAAGLQVGDIIESVDSVSATVALCASVDDQPPHHATVAVRYARFAGGYWKVAKANVESKPNSKETNDDIVAFEASHVRASESIEHSWPSAGLKGNAKVIGAQLNEGVEDAWALYFSARGELSEKNSEIDSETDADLTWLKRSDTYLEKFREMNTADAAAKAARVAEDANTALEQGGIVNNAKAALAKMEAKALADDPKLAADNAMLPAMREKLKLREASLLKATEWRSRVIRSMQNTSSINWPVTTGKEIFLAGGKAVSVSDATLSVETDADELLENVEKNGGGDGIDVYTYIPHKIVLTIPKPENCKATPGDLVRLNTVLRITAKTGETDDVPRFSCEPDGDGEMSVLFTAIEDLHGPSAKYLDAVDVEVAAAIDKECRR
jgi:hypothetical protein